MLSVTYYAQLNAGMIGWSLTMYQQPMDKAVEDIYYIMCMGLVYA